MIFDGLTTGNNINVYAVNQNVLSVMSGMGGLAHPPNFLKKSLDKKNFLKKVLHQNKTLLTSKNS